MPLSAGSRIGAFEVLSRLGAGGMGEVYRARDTKLGRDVALKVLPDTFALDADRLMRFRREAQVLASLSHPNIAHIYGLEDESRITAIVMELVEGPTLADRIAQGPIPLDEALAIARQIAQALDAAHERGIVHRDLKPGNIKLADDGTVKVLDFGLAKALDPSGAGDVANSPTITSPAMTARGVILGTAAYMAPEQAKGRAVDKRADIFAFGVVLYEMLRGRHLFRGETVSEILAAVIKEEPAFDGVPFHLRPLLKRCLEKDPKKRLRDIGDVELLLDRPVDSPARGVRGWAPWALAAACAGLGLVAVVVMALGDREEARRTVEFYLDAPAGMQFAPPDMGSLSPNGEWIVFGVQESSGLPVTLWRRSVGSATVRRLEGTEGAGPAFWSADSQSIAFTARNKLKRLNLAGGSPIDLCDWDTRGPGTWNRDGVIVVSGDDGLFRVPASGGAATRLTTVDVARGESIHTLPQFLPDGNRFLYFIRSDNPEVRGVYVSALDRPDRRERILAVDSKALYVSRGQSRPGLLLFVRGSTLVAQTFDVATLQTSGEPAVVAEGLAVFRSFQGAQAPFWASDAGVLLYRRGMFSFDVNWISRDGRRSPSGIPAGTYLDLRLSPSADRLAIVRRLQDGGEDISQWDFARGVWTLLTSDGRSNQYPIWSPDGRQVAFTFLGARQSTLYRRHADGSGEAVEVGSARGTFASLDWSRDGRFILFHQTAGPRSPNENDIWSFAVESTPREPVPVIGGPFSQRNAKFSPIGKWIAFGSNHSGRQEVYVQQFDDTGPKAPTAVGARWPVSRGGGTSPLWRGDGKELFFITPENKLMAAELSFSTSSVSVGAIRELFGATFFTLNVQPYDVAPDGKRFLVLEARDRGLHPPFTVAVNWQDAPGK